MVRLRGNTFLLLLLREGKPTLYDHPEFGEGKDGITRPNLFADLIRFTDPEYMPKKMDSLGVYFSQYLSGDRPNSPSYFPFNKPAYRDGLNIRLQSKRGSVLRQMDTFCRKYLTMNEISNKALVSSLVDAMINDESFAGSIDTGYKIVEKADLGSETQFILQPFLVSVWNNILMNHPDTSEGTQTFKDWTNNKGFNTPTDVVTDIGRKRMAKISVSTMLPECEDEIDADEEYSEPDIPPSDDDAEGCVDDVVENGSYENQDTEFYSEDGEYTDEPDDETYDDAEDTIKNQTLVNNGKIVNQHAKKIYNIEHIDTFYG